MAYASILRKPCSTTNGWNLQKSEIRSVCALSRLWFILAAATLNVTAQSVAVVQSGQHCRVDPHWFRGNSYFRIGRDWVRTVLGIQTIAYCNIPDRNFFLELWIISLSCIGIF